MKKWLLVVSVMAIMAVAGCSSSEAKEGNGKEQSYDYTIGVSQIVEHPSLDAAQEGFKAAFDEADLSVKFDVQLAQGDAKNNQTIADNFVGDEVDLIFANSTGSAQSALNATDDIPIVFTSVTDPVGSNLVDSMEAPGGNVTGTTDTHPDAIPNTISFMKEEMGVEKVGMLYNPSEQNSSSQVERVKEIAGDQLEIKTATVTTSAEVKQAAESLAGKVDALYIVTDNTVVSALESVLIVGQEEDTPVLVGELDSVERGGFAAYGFDYYDIGFEAGQKAIEILEEGKNPGDIEVSYPQNLKLQINQKAAEEMGVDIQDDWKEEAEIIEK
ncbi:MULTISPECIES: ABC transporter substrate-binding protein [Pontibacillus]|uniref:ABC transporter substrate-binding protein n=1 Tax=Pontibacillus chungwhensis TaxID=265426 RepID=A0ABY8UZK8_9BACI|nr:MULTISPECIES: ABC transporter substrate-binding protein [Pontibacillus]MCD5324993.1 ABC transporter substrate-binding protein [Pontibacillus sp. HN14]WIF98947.1 ABC transporter substrate-binding protein [Pontibacillus chungwhensis]